MRNLGLQEVIHHHKAVRRESQASRTEESNPRVHAFTLPSVLPLHTWASRHKGCLPDSMAPSTTLWRNSTLSKGPAGPSEIDPTLILIKTLSKLGKERNYFNLIKSIYTKSKANVIPSGERLKASPLRSCTRQGGQLSPVLFNTALKVLATAMREGGRKAYR